MEQQTANQTLEVLKNLESKVAPKTFEMLVAAQKAQALSGLVCSILFFACLLFICVFGYKKFGTAIIAKHNKVAESKNDLDITFLNSEISMLNFMRVVLVVSCICTMLVSISSMLTEINVYLYPEAAVVRQMFGR